MPFPLPPQQFGINSEQSENIPHASIKQGTFTIPLSATVLEGDFKP